MRSGAGMEVHGVSEKNLLKLVMKKRCAHTDKNLKLLIRIHMPSAGHNLEIVSSSRKDAKSGVSSRELFVNLRAGPEMPHKACCYAYGSTRQYGADDVRSHSEYPDQLNDMAIVVC